MLLERDRVPRNETIESTRLSDVLFGAKGFDSLAAIPSNVEAIETASMFSAGLQTFAALVGPSGWGKTHILEAVARRLRYEAGYSECNVRSARDWVADTVHTDPHVPLILDNVQDILSKSRSRVRLRLALERRTKAGRPTILGFTSNKAGRAIRSLLPQPRAWAISSISNPAPSERQIIVAKIAQTEGVIISDGLVRLLSHRLKGNGLTIRGAMKRLRLHDGNWLGANGTLRACGVLNPFFSDNSSWDLRDHIMACAKSFGLEYATLSSQDLAIYIMLRQASLGEADVARFFDIEPAQAYNIAARLERKITECQQSSEIVQRFIETTVERLRAD